MSADRDLKDLWNKKKVDTPSSGELIEKAQKFNKSKVFKLVALNLLLLATIVVIIIIWFKYEPNYITSKIGIVFMLIPIILFTLVYNSTLPLLINKDHELDLKKQLTRFKKLKSKQMFMQTTMINLYFIFLSIGVSLYLYEFVSMYSFTGLITAYTITFLWIAFNWFYLRPRIVKKQRVEIDRLIQKFQHLIDQLKV